MFIMFNNLA